MWGHLFMEENGFYVTLPSNTSFSLFSFSFFIFIFMVSLTKTLELDDAWEVGISESYTWYNIPSLQAYYVAEQKRTLIVI